MAGASESERGAALFDLAREAVGRPDVVQVSMTEPAPIPDGLRRERGGRWTLTGRGWSGPAGMSCGGRIVSVTPRRRISGVRRPWSRGCRGRWMSVWHLGRLRGRAELSGHGLSDDQVHAALTVLTSRVAGDVVVGPAGAGKSRTMSALAQVWSREVGGGCGG
ncbi:hypothetical protein Ae717Ps2_5867c [Pseudonocardia sp. Ae717_Ps2]|nr:hypothetical protein Ae717Ps2_5867c [Pseudonocardia sp. Ae717_Ps2]